MAVAAEPYLSACMELLYRSTLLCRMWGWSGEVSAEHLSELMDAVHNVPALVQDWERCDLKLLRDVLGDYQAKWLRRGGLALLEIFDGIVAGVRV